MNEKGSFEKQLCNGYILTTAEIIYHLPDRPHLLQSYVWQDYDLAPRYPVLTDFLAFWMRELDGPVHSVVMAHQRLMTPSDFYHYSGDYLLQ